MTLYLTMVWRCSSVRKIRSGIALATKSPTSRTISSVTTLHLVASTTRCSSSWNCSPNAPIMSHTATRTLTRSCSRIWHQFLKVSMSNGAYSASRSVVIAWTCSRLQSLQKTRKKVWLSQLGCIQARPTALKSCMASLSFWLRSTLMLKCCAKTLSLRLSPWLMLTVLCMAIIGAVWWESIWIECGRIHLRLCFLRFSQ